MKVKIKPMTPGVPRSARVRAYAACFVITLGLAGAAMKAWALQVDNGAHYRALAARQHAMLIKIPAPRGEVTDVQGRPLAISADADSVWANPREVRDVTGTAEKLAQLIDPAGSAATLEAKLAGDRAFVWIDRHVTPAIAKAVREAKLPGVEVASEPRRWYPAKAVAGPVIGRADIDGNGLDGIELAMNDLLHGKRGAVKALRDARGRKMLADQLAPAEPGANVRLTLDRSIQAIADGALAESVERHKAKSGLVVVLDVATSKVLAMASYPTFDPNGENVHGARNRPVTDAFEAGSVMKVFTVAAALEDGLVKPTSGFMIGPGWRVGPKWITDTHEYPYLTVNEIIKASSNIGAAKIAMRLGRDRLHRYLKQMGFGNETGIELPGEQNGKLRPAQTWRDVELATMSYGYGLTVTPLQIAAGMAAIGNRGIYHAPRIVDQVTDGDGSVVYRGNAEPRRMLSEKTASAMVAMLASVFEKGHGQGTVQGTAASIVVPGFRCGGKTGTAHKYDPALKGYSPNRYLSSFAGLAPIDNPRLAIVVMIDEPSGGDYFGGKVAGPVFAKVASESLRYLGVPGEKIVPLDARGKPIPLGPDGKPLPQDRWGNYIQPKPKRVVATPVEPEPEPEPEPELDPAAIMIPDFGGMGVGRALDEARKLHLDVEVVGSGQVVEQDPPPGPTTNAGRIKLRFSDDTRKISAR